MFHSRIQADIFILTVLYSKENTENPQFKECETLANKKMVELSRASMARTVSSVEPGNGRILCHKKTLRSHGN